MYENKDNPIPLAYPMTSSQLRTLWGTCVSCVPSQIVSGTAAMRINKYKTIQGEGGLGWIWEQAGESISKTCFSPAQSRFFEWFPSLLPYHVGLTKYYENKGGWKTQIWKVMYTATGKRGPRNYLLPHMAGTPVRQSIAAQAFECHTSFSLVEGQRKVSLCQDWIVLQNALKCMPL